VRPGQDHHAVGVAREKIGYRRDRHR
jgi:hypothetical protein